MVEFFKTTPAGTVRVDAPSPGCWVNVVAPTPEERAWLTDELGVLEEFMRSATDDEESSHVDYDEDAGQTLVIVDYPQLDTSGQGNDPAVVQYDTRPLSLLLLPERGLVVTVCLYECETINALAGGRVRQLDTGYRTRFLLQVLLHISQQYQACLRTISKQFTKTEAQLRSSLRNADLIKMLGLEKSLTYFATSLKADEATLGKIRTGRVVKVYDDDQELLDDVLIEIAQAVEMCTVYTGILTRTMDTFGSVISNNLNSAMRRLTIVTLVLAMPTIVYSFYGMNVADLPLAQTWLVPFGLSVIIAGLVSALFAWSKLFK